MADEGKSYRVEIYFGNPDPTGMQVRSGIDVQDHVRDSHVRDKGLPLVPIRGRDPISPSCDYMYSGIEDREYAVQLTDCINELPGVAAKVVEV